MRVIALLLMVSLVGTQYPVHGHEAGVLGTQRMAWSVANVARVDALATYTRSPVMLASKAAPARVEIRAGRNCLVGGLFVFDVDDHFAFDIDEPVALDVTLDFTASSGFVLLYDEATVSAGVRHVRVAEPVSGRWQTVTVNLDRARFANRMRLHSDLVLAAPGSLFSDPQALWTGHASEREIAVCGLSLARSRKGPAQSVATGKLDLTVFDAEGQPTPARVGLYDPTGKLPIPGPGALPIRIFDDTYRTLPLVEGWEAWPVGNREVFYVGGHYTTDLPAADYDLVVAKGPEYRVTRSRIRVEPGNTAHAQVQLQRWTDMPSRGWYSGDGHIHIGRQRADNPGVLAFMQAEDLHVANLLQMGTLTNSYFQQYAFGPAERFVERDYALVSGEETPRTTEIGHHSGLNIRRYHALHEYHRIDRYAAQIEREGGLFGYMHVNLEFGGIDRSMALGLPLGIGTHVEVLQAGMLNTRLMDDFLNLGFKVVPISGSDFPYITLPGADRTYVYTGSAFSTDAWFEALHGGRVFVSNGPILELSVAGHGPGSDVDVADGDSLKVVAHAAINPDVDHLERVELVVHGRVLAVGRPAPGSDVIDLAYDWHPEASAWIDARAFGVNGTEALTGPVYVYRSGDRWFGSAAQLPCLVPRYRAKLQELRDLVPDHALDLERWDYTREQLLTRWEEERHGMNELISRAEHVYEELSRRAPARSIDACEP